MRGAAAVLLDGAATPVDEYRDWRADQTNAPAVPPDVPPGAPDAPPSRHQQPTRRTTAFTWAFGGFNGSRAALSEPRIAALAE